MLVLTPPPLVRDGSRSHMRELVHRGRCYLDRGDTIERVVVDRWGQRESGAS